MPPFRLLSLPTAQSPSTSNFSIWFEPTEANSSPSDMPRGLQLARRAAPPAPWTERAFCRVWECFLPSVTVSEFLFRGASPARFSLGLSARAARCPHLEAVSRLSPAPAVEPESLRTVPRQGRV